MFIIRIKILLVFIFSLTQISCVFALDDKELVEKSYLIYPNYRGLLLKNSNDTLKALFEFNSNYKGESFSVIEEFIDSKGIVLETKKRTINVDNTCSVLFEGKYSFKTENLNSVVWKITMKFKELSYSKYFDIFFVEKYPDIYIAKDGFIRINGNKFFPFGIYTGTTEFWASDGGSGKSSFDDLNKMKKAGYNLVLSYFYGSNQNNRGKLFLENAKKNDLRVIYAIKDLVKDYQKNKYEIKNIVDSLKSESSLFSWYINDEMQNYSDLDSAYNDISKIDNQHPVFQVTNMLNLLPNFYESTDIIATDPYPIGDRFKSRNTLDNVTLSTIKTVGMSKNSKTPWEVIQLHNLDFINKNKTSNIKPPTLNQIRNMTYQALVNGAKGLMFFAYHWLYFDRNKDGQVILNDAAFSERWTDVLKLNEEIIPITNVILEDNVCNLSVVQGDVSAFKAWYHNNLIFLLVVNNSTTDNIELSFKMPSSWFLKENKAPSTSTHIDKNIFSVRMPPVSSGYLIFSK